MTAESLPPPAAPAAAELDSILLAAESADIGFYRVDLATGRIECTPICKRNVGATSTSLTLEGLRDLIIEEDRAHLDDQIGKAIESRGEYAAEYRVLHPDGSMHWISARGRFVSDSLGEGIVGATIDVTDRRETQERLRAQQDLNALITANVAEGICFMDAGGGITYMNPTAEEILGWKLEELRGQVLHNVVHYKRADGTPFPMAECALGRTLTHGEAVRNQEDYWIHKSGALIPVLSSSVPINVDGRTVGSVLSIHDITSRKAIEQALRDASKAKDEFLATVSHELRTPMTSVLGWIGYLKLIGLPPETAEIIDHLERSAKAQASLVDDLLDVSRAATGKLRLNFSQVDLVEIVTRSLQTVEPTASAKAILVTFEAAPDLWVAGDAARLEQVATNLLTNALKFTPEGGRVSLTVSASESEAVLTVSDNGVGIDPEFLRSVFDRFFQAPAAGRTTGGLGLGLAIVKQLVDAHGGSVSAESAGKGHGSTFRVTLPLANV